MPKVLEEEDLGIAKALIFWAADVILPTQEFAGSWEEIQLANGKFMT